jgi:hypothetical protein
VNLKDALRNIQSDRSNLFHRAAPFLAVHTATALWHLDAGGGSRPLHQRQTIQHSLSAPRVPVLKAAI